jgi:rhodanese-related sulfurtransferase
MNRTHVIAALVIQALFAATQGAFAAEPAGAVVVDTRGTVRPPTADAMPRDPEATTRGGLYATPDQTYRTKRQLGKAVLLIDVRSVEERRRGGATQLADLHIPFLTSGTTSSVAEFLAAVGRAVASQPRGNATPIFLLCENGRVAAAAVDALESAGYSNAIVVTGGLNGEIEGGRAGWIGAKVPLSTNAAATGAPSWRQGEQWVRGSPGGLTPLPLL